MPRTTINTLIAEAIGDFPLEVQQRMLDAGLVRKALSDLSIPGMPILVEDLVNEDPDDQWSGRDLNELDIDRQIARAFVDEARYTIDVIVRELSTNDGRLKSVA